MKFKSFTLALFTFCAAAASGMNAAQAVTFKTVASGYDNVNHATFGPDGYLYISEGGVGGDGDGGKRCTPSPSTQYVPICTGDTGAITKLDVTTGQSERIISNLPSLAQQPLQDQGAGPADIQFYKGKAYLVYGMAGDPRNRDSVLDSPTLAQFYEIDLKTGEKKSLADFAKYETEFNPDGTDLIVNPYSLAIKDDYAYITDGGANVIYKVGLNGEGIVKVNAFPRQNVPVDELKFPKPEDLGLGPEQSIAFQPTEQSVPTGIKVGPDGSLYATEYTFFPYPEGKSRVWKISDDLEQFTTVAEGFTQLTDLAFDKQGSLYLLQHYNTPEWEALAPNGDKSGSIIKVAADGTRETVYSGPELGAASVLDFGPDGKLYAVSGSRFAKQGTVLAFDLEEGEDGAKKVPEPAAVVGLVAVAGFAGKMLKRKRQEELLAKVETL
ncbi:ScyD/ScyE family protein [Scytonema sp. NUACC26]|uniref:ScyD/ScyE family protein n=1 Tax=Scytonema sp. NUACC26 TaxID=3140176 RepID=UPI0034DC2433